MKLYFYILTSDGMTMKECTAEEKPLTYREGADRSFPTEYTSTFVRKADIGKVIGYSKNIIVLSDVPNSERAAETFAAHVKNKIERYKDSLRGLEKTIINLNETLQKLESMF